VNTLYIQREYIFLREITMATTIDINKCNLIILDKKDPRMRFRNSKDPLYVAYDYLDNQSISQLAVSFVIESFKDAVKFVSKVIPR